MIDLGSSTVKAGYAGEDTPKALFPSVSIAPFCWLKYDTSAIANVRQICQAPQYLEDIKCLVEMA